MFEVMMTSSGSSVMATIGISRDKSSVLEIEPVAENPSPSLVLEFRPQAATPFFLKSDQTSCE